MVIHLKSAFICVLVLFSPALAARVERLIDKWRPTHYLVSLTLNDQLSEITSASARINVLIVKQTSVIDLDFGELTTDKVTLGSKPLSFTHKNGKLEVVLPAPATPGTRFTLTVDYHGKPKDGLILTKDKDGKPSAVGDNWPNRVHHWIPSFDHPSAKATVTFNITAPAREEVVANGRLDHVETSANGQRTWTFTEGVPIPPYCMIIAVGQFARVVPTQSSITPVSYYVTQSEKDLALKGFSPTIPSLEFFSETIAPYPYEKLAMIVGATSFGGMENSSAIVFTANLLTRPGQVSLSKTYGIPGANVSLIAHEIAHQWFGDSVTESTWADLWLSEGFAVYFGNLFVQRFEGETVFQTYMNQAAANVFAYEKKTLMPIHDRETEDLMDLLNALNYQKGAWVLHMLRARMGDKAFFRGIRNYYAAHKNSTASTEDLRAALEHASGKDLRAFFARWVYDSGHPQYELSWQWLRNRELRVELKQLQPGNAFLDPVTVTITTASGKRDIILKPTGKQLIETVPLRETPLKLALDPLNVLLDESTVKGI
ncbi:MAG TPA: M1 family metallopeptidase [Pyrinomonadaceae bacterium]